MTIDVTPDGVILVNGRKVARTNNPEAVRARLKALGLGLSVTQERLAGERVIE